MTTATAEERFLVAAANTRPSRLAEAIAISIRKDQRAIVDAAGANAIQAVVKALAILRSTSGHDIVTSSDYHTTEGPNGGEMTVFRFELRREDRTGRTIAP